MAARSPRRSFATPFVVTLAAAPACYVQSGPPPQQPTPTTTATNTAQPEPGTQPDPGTQAPPGTQPTTKPPPVMVNPPRPQATTPNAKWRIYADASGKCFSQPVATCPPNVMCNPPPPKAYDCPTQIDLKASGGNTIVSSADGMTCSVDWGPMNCPAGATCNPPPPVSVTCPRP